MLILDWHRMSGFHMGKKGAPDGHLIDPLSGCMQYNGWRARTLVREGVPVGAGDAPAAGRRRSQREINSAWFLESPRPSGIEGLQIPCQQSRQACTLV